MTKKKQTESSELRLSPALAAAYLSSRLGQSTPIWTDRLANWRRPGRTGPLQATVTDAGRPAYAQSDLEAFAASQESTKSIIGCVDRPRVGATPCTHEPEDPHVRLMVAIGSVSMSVFHLEPDSSRRLAHMLTKAADAVELAIGAKRGST